MHQTNCDWLSVVIGNVHGAIKVNVGTEIRQAYESALRKSGNVAAAQDAVYRCASWLIRDYFRLAGNRRIVTG